jgi:opacity protein-like surface antigen
MPRKRQTLLLPLILARVMAIGLLPSVVSAQERQVQTQPPAPGKPGASDPLELLPAIGKIGAEVGGHGGWSKNPYGLGSGAQGVGFINLPLKKVGGAVLSYQIAIRFARSTSDPVTVTNPIAFVANLAATGRGETGPFPYRRVVRSTGSIFLVEPFGFKYAVHSFGRFRPYAVAGAGVAVVITKEVPEADESQVFRGTSPFDADLLAGLVAQARELEALGRPTGQGNIEVAGHVGAGFEYRLSPGLSFQADYRFTKLTGRNSSMHMASGGFGIHF